MNGRKFDITIDARMINHSGIGTYIKNMIPNLIGHYNLALLGNFQILESFPWSEQVKVFSANYPIYSISEQINLPRQIPESRLFISPHYNIPLLKIPADKRVVIIHDINHLVSINKISVIKKIYARYMISAAVKKSDKVITDSFFSRNEIIKHVRSEGKEIKTLYCGINDEALKNYIKPPYKENIKLKYNLPENYFLYVGSSKRHKNLISVLKAFNLLLQEYSNQKLVVLGVKHDEYFNNKEFVNLKEGVILPGYITDTELPAIYANALCLVFPSLYEGFGLPPLEAMSCGCPVIASNVTSIPEVCNDAALYFDPLNIEEIASTMKQILEDEKTVSQLREKGFNNLKKFTWQIFAQNLKNEFDDLIFG
ncbi:MAG: glycosyltransferase family 4 protein [Ignavibacteriaceae bacterium]|nr:glycosyltransferase family 4 protein [Ignavibacteriaceae bacterium]